ncbi:MAG TPA: hypothetical protein VEK32_07000 [Thermodesulfobacteriota bacterium]|nr:hypothetical protein [Thermodesulfobacteriota bacterium]
MKKVSLIVYLKGMLGEWRGIEREGEKKDLAELSFYEDSILL